MFIINLSCSLMVLDIYIYIYMGADLVPLAKIRGPVPLLNYSRWIPILSNLTDKTYFVIIFYLEILQKRL